MTDKPDPTSTTIATDEDNDSGFGEGSFRSNASSFAEQKEFKPKQLQPIYY